jgi:predicted DNA-binding protein
MKRATRKKGARLKILCSFKLKPDLLARLAKEAAKLGKTKTRIVEEALTSKLCLKSA